MKSIAQLRERSRGLAHTGVTNELVRAVNRLAPPMRNGQVETPPPWPGQSSPLTLFAVSVIPDDMPSGSGSGSSSNGTQLKAAYVIATKVSDTSASPTPYLIRVVYPHAVGDAFYAQQPDGGAGWAYQHTWYASDPTGGSNDGSFPSGSGSGNDEFTTADPIAWVEQPVSPTPFNVRLSQDGGDNTAPTYTVVAGPETNSVTIATSWSPTRLRPFVSEMGLEITVAGGGVSGFDGDGNFFLAQTDEQYQLDQECFPGSGSGSSSGSGSG